MKTSREEDHKKCFGKTNLGIAKAYPGSGPETRVFTDKSGHREHSAFHLINMTFIQRDGFLPDASNLYPLPKMAISKPDSCICLGVGPCFDTVPRENISGN
jgi:hypothetical protein